MTPPVFRLAAAADVEEAFRWYQKQRRGLGDEFLTAVQATLDLVVTQPRGFPTVHRDTLRALLRRFPYGLFYRLIDDGVVVVACFHAKRDPRSWRGRR